jgi:hypothetical protein
VDTSWPGKGGNPASWAWAKTMSPKIAISAAENLLSMDHSLVWGDASTAPYFMHPEGRPKEKMTYWVW